MHGCTFTAAFQGWKSWFMNHGWQLHTFIKSHTFGQKCSHLPVKYVNMTGNMPVKTNFRAAQCTLLLVLDRNLHWFSLQALQIYRWGTVVRHVVSYASPFLHLCDFGQVQSYDSGTGNNMSLNNETEKKTAEHPNEFWRENGNFKFSHLRVSVVTS